MAIVAEDSKIMALANTDLTWSLYSDRFVTFGNELKLYVVDSINESPQIFGGVQLNDLIYSQILFSKCEVRYVKSMACNNRLLTVGTNVLYALGFQSGKIVLNSFESNAAMGKDTSDPSFISALVGKEFIPEYSRPCNALDFCQIDNNLLASGFDKSRNDFSVMVWDIAHTGINYNQAAQSATISGTTKPLHQFAPNEQVHSLRWFQDKNLICGMNQKYIKFLDIREPTNQASCACTKGVYGITPDTHSEYRFASFFDNFVYVWDLRSFESPLISIGPEPSSFVKLEWCPTRANILAALLKDTNSIRLYDYKHYTNYNDLPEPSIVKRDITPFEVNNPQIISSFSWHPLNHNANAKCNECQMTVVTSNGVIRDFKVVDRITLNWSPISEIIWTHGKRILQCIDSRDSIYKEIDDIAVRMRRMAMEGYGLSVDKLWQMFSKENPLYFVWKWVALRFKDEPIFKNHSMINSDDSIFDVFSPHNPDRFAGISDLLFTKGHDRKLLHQSDLITEPPNTLRKKRIFTSPSRAKALQFCGWSDRHFRFMFPDHYRSLISDDFSVPQPMFDAQMPCDHFVSSNESEHNFTRVAAVMVFNGRFSEAIDCLNRAADFTNKHLSGRSNDQGKLAEKAVALNAIALALSAFVASAEQIELGNYFIWNDICSRLKPKLDDSYIKAIFNFISIDFDEKKHSYQEIIRDEKIDIADRVAFACMYLSDLELTDYLGSLQNSLINRFDLRDILLTGLSDDGLKLFTKYVENTSDVQTISLILLWTLPNSLYQVPIAKAWVDTYKQLLDCWRLWKIRAQFDLKWYDSLDHLEEPRQQIYIVCNYCRSPISTYTHNETSNTKSPSSHLPPMSHHIRASSTNSPAHKLRTCSCSNCGKTLPRCSLCLTQLGTPAGIYWRPGFIIEKANRKLSPFASWFTWCQTCRHGGHSAHLLEWFTENAMCPVAGCKCKCMSLDANARAANASNI